MMTKPKTKRGGRRPDLLAAARKLFFKRGYVGTTIEHVASAAGFSKRTVYLYFKNKDELFISVAETGLVELREQLEAIPVLDLDVEEAIGAITVTYLDFARRNPEYFRMIFREATAEMVANVPEEMRRRIEGHEHACLNIVATVVDVAVAQGRMPPINRWEIAVMFWGMVTGIILLSLGGSQTVFGRRTREELITKAIWILFEGLKETDGYFRADTGAVRKKVLRRAPDRRGAGRKKAGGK